MKLIEEKCISRLQLKAQQLAFRKLAFELTNNEGQG